MAENYQFERTSVAATGATPVTILAAPPSGISYRIFYINGYNNSGGTRSLFGRITKNGTSYVCYFAAVANNNVFNTQVSNQALAEHPTIAVLADTDEKFEIYLSGSGTPVISLMYEIVDQTGQRTFRSGLATTISFTLVTLVPAPTSETVHRVLNVNALNDAGGTRIMFLRAGTTDFLSQLSAANNAVFRRHVAANQAPFPPLILSGTSDTLGVTLSSTGAIPVSAPYEVLDRRVV